MSQYWDWRRTFVKLRSPTGRVVSMPLWQRSRRDSLGLRDQELWFVRQGRGWMATRRERLDLHAGFCAWMRPGGIYDAGQDERRPLGIFYLHFDLVDARGRRLPEPRLRHAPEFWHYLDAAFFDPVLSRIVELFGQHERSGDPQPLSIAESLLHAVLMDLCSRHEPAAGAITPSVAAGRWQRRLAELAAEIREKPAAAKPIAAMAKSLDLTAAHFCRLFRKFHGTSPRDFVIDARVSHARQMLLESDREVSDIAAALGYRDIFFFSRQFKHHTGVSPTEFRARVRHG